MSTTQEVLPILLRSTTPVASEKVLIWTQKMQEEEPLPPEKDADQSEPDTDHSNPVLQHNNEAFEHTSHRSFHASTPRFDSSPNDTKVLEDLANSKSGVDYAGVADPDEFASNVQERSQTHSRRSSMNKSVINNDEHSPALKHNSHDSFGNLDAAAFDINKPNGDSASIRSARSPLKAPNIDVRSPTPSDPDQKGSRHSRAPSRLSNVQVASVHESDDDSGTTRDENDARTIPVETVRVPSRAGSHKAKSVASHAAPLSERGRAMSPTGSARPKSRVSALSPPPQNHGVKSPSVHPSQMPLPSSSSIGPTPKQNSVALHPLSNFGGSHRGGSNYVSSERAQSVHAPPERAPSVHAPSERAQSAHGQSQHGGSQYGQSQKQVPSRAPSRAPTGKQPSQASSSQHGGSAMGNGPQAEQRRDTSLHPLSSHPGVYGNVVNGSKYGGGGGSQHSQHTPSLHPLTQHLAAQSNRSYSRSSQHQHQQNMNMPYLPPHSAEDMIHAGVRGRVMAVSPTPSNPHGLPQPPPFPYPPHHHAQTHPHHHHHHPHHYIPDYMEETPSQMQMRPRSPDMLNEDEQHMVDELLLVRTPRTSYTVTPSALAAEVHNSSFHDEDLCILLHAADDDSIHDVVKKAVRKAIRGRVRKLGAKYEAALRRYHSPDGSQRDMRLLPQQQSTPQASERGVDQDEPPIWARDMIALMQETRTRLEDLERRKKTRSYAPTESQFDDTTIRNTRSRRGGLGGSVTNDVENASPITVTMPMHTPGRAGTIIEESVLVPGETEFTQGESVHGHTIASEHHHDGSNHDVEDEEEAEEGDEGGDDGDYRPEEFDVNGQLQRDESPGKQVLEDAIFHLHSKTPRTDCTHQSWEVQEATDTEVRLAFPPVAESEMIADIPDTEEIVSEIPRFEVERKASPGPPVALENRENGVQAYHHQPGEWAVAEPPTPPPWQRIHQRLLNWAIVWPMAELDQALNSTTRGHQVDEIALSIWCTQTYKRYVRARLTEHPPMRVDRLFIPPNVADAINAAVYNGRHGDACGMLRDMWTPFGLDGMPRLLLVLCKHRKEENHWVVHRFSLPDGSLTTYDTYPERSLPDGRPLGWWFAIRIAWPNAMYPSPEHLAQRMVRIHRPMQLGIDNSVATAGIWRNLLMGSKAERSIDLERLRDLINTEVKNLRTRKETGKLSVSAPRQHWDEIA